MDPQRLAKLPLFVELSDDQLGDIAACTRAVSIAEGETIATQGDNAYEFFVVEEGEADVRRDGDVIAWVGRATSSARSGCWSRARARLRSSRAPR